MSINDKYLELIMPSLEYEEGGGIDYKETKEGKCITFQCPFCTGYIKGDRYRTKHTAKLVHQKDGYGILFHCKRGWSPECKNGYKVFRNFLHMFNPLLGVKYDKEIASLKRC